MLWRKTTRLNQLPKNLPFYRGSSVLPSVSFADLSTVTTALFRRTKWRKQLFSPVRCRFFYQSPLGLFVNLVMAWSSMYPPFFVTAENPLPEKRAFDRCSMRVLTELCRNAP